MQQLRVRHRITHAEEFPPFSDRSLRQLSFGDVAAEVPPPGFADSFVPIRGATLAQALYLSGIFSPPALCSGIGRCGFCRVRFLSAAPPILKADTEALSHHDCDAGWRLACRHAPEPGMHVLVPALLASHAAPETTAPRRTPEHTACGLAVDLGTTSVHWRFTSPRGVPRTDMPGGVMINPQMGAGSDVLSRLAHAATNEGAATLRGLVTDALARIIARGDAAGFRVEALCVAANPAMTAIFLGQETSGLARAPYSLPDKGGKMAHVPGLPPVYIPPQVSPFVGGDASAGYAALALDPDGAKPEFPFLLADLGTNGECVLALSESRALAASLPMGPALEGVNLSSGCLAGPGAITEYALTPLGLEPKVMGDTAPTGITATGYLTLIRALRATNLLTEDGLFAAAATSLSHRAGGEGVGRSHAPRIRLPGKMVLHAADVEEILKVKAAFTLAVSSLLREAALPAAGIRRVFLAGALGSHAPVAALTDLGFLPAILGAKVTCSGNTALAGAALLLARDDVRETCAAWAERVETLDLASAPSFGEAFARHMVFAWRS